MFRSSWICCFLGLVQFHDEVLNDKPSIQGHTFDEEVHNEKKWQYLSSNPYPEMMNRQSHFSK